VRSMISNPARGHSFRAAFVGTNDEAAGPKRPPSARLVRTKFATTPLRRSFGWACCAPAHKKIGGNRPGAGRPATGADPVTAIHLSAELRANVDAWGAAQDDEPSRSEAIRRLVEIGLKAKK
jgi:hypothetical protein